MKDDGLDDLRHMFGREADQTIVAHGVPLDAWSPLRTWGDVVVDQRLGDFLTLRAFRTPEGIVMIGHCNRCGGRSERLLDCRHLPKDITAGQLNGRFAAAFASMEEEMVAHIGCQTQPLEHQLPGVIEEAIQELARQWRSLFIQEGKALAPILVVLSRETKIVTRHEIPAGLPAAVTRVLEQSFAYTVREFLRARDWDVVGMVLLRPQQGGNILDFTVVTPNYAKTAWASGVRLVADGTAFLEWREPALVPNPLADGLLATTTARLTEQQLERGFGRTIQRTVYAHEWQIFRPIGGRNLRVINEGKVEDEHNEMDHEEIARDLREQCETGDLIRVCGYLFTVTAWGIEETDPTELGE